MVENFDLREKFHKLDFIFTFRPKSKIDILHVDIEQYDPVSKIDVECFIHDLSFDVSLPVDGYGYLGRICRCSIKALI